MIDNFHIYVSNNGTQVDADVLHDEDKAYFCRASEFFASFEERPQSKTHVFEDIQDLLYVFEFIDEVDFSKYSKAGRKRVENYLAENGASISRYRMNKDDILKEVKLTYQYNVAMIETVLRNDSFNPNVMEKKWSFRFKQEPALEIHFRDKRWEIEFHDVQVAGESQREVRARAVTAFFSNFISNRYQDEIPFLIEVVELKNGIKGVYSRSKVYPNEFPYQSIQSYFSDEVQSHSIWKKVNSVLGGKVLDLLLEDFLKYECVLHRGFNYEDLELLTSGFEPVQHLPRLMASWCERNTLYKEHEFLRTLKIVLVQVFCEVWRERGRLSAHSGIHPPEFFYNKPYKSELTRYLKDTVYLVKLAREDMNKLQSVDGVEAADVEGNLYFAPLRSHLSADFHEAYQSKICLGERQTELDLFMDGNLYFDRSKVPIASRMEEFQTLFSVPLPYLEISLPFEKMFPIVEIEGVVKVLNLSQFCEFAIKPEIEKRELHW